MDIYKVKYNNETDGDLYAISIVDSPANGFEFIAMSEYKEIRLSSDEKKQILYGIVLRPEQKIYREHSDGTPFYLTFDASTIERLSQDFMKKGYQRNATYNHQDNKWLDDTVVTEQWLVKDKHNDKGSAIGLPVENGDWVVGIKLGDKSWSEYIETGKAKGFSIDSFIQFEKINNEINSRLSSMESIESIDSNNNPNGYKKEKSIMKDIFTKIVKLFSEEGVINMATFTTSIGDLTADAFEIGNVVYNADGQPVMDSEFQFENKVYKTDNTGTINEISDVIEEQSDSLDTNLDDTKLEDIQPEVSTAVDDAASTIVEEVSKPVEEVDVELLKQQIADLQLEVEKITKQKDEVLMENTQLKETVASVKLKAEVRGITPITMKSKETSAESTLDALSRITKKLN